MSTRRLTDQGDARVPSVVLVCTACQHTWEPDLVDPTDRSEATSTGCPLCGGWTWIGQITEPGHRRVSPATPSTSRSTTR
ncbi:MAG: hypothetical protein M3319_08540 [Actinomycetota bacterium]|nr:hypothetical protein [Actinomycetota bacterium]MDQ3900474.1 hypothetical protein [Actinomycetota bacterium]